MRAVAESSWKFLDVDGTARHEETYAGRRFLTQCRLLIYSVIY
jgi:hypothetical protein